MKDCKKEQTRFLTFTMKKYRVDGKAITDRIKHEANSSSSNVLELENKALTAITSFL